jgi:hypothetical protein
VFSRNSSLIIGRASSSSRQRDLTPCSSCTGSRTQRGTAS